jgi:hypothetical protein
LYAYHAVTWFLNFLELEKNGRGLNGIERLSLQSIAKRQKSIRSNAKRMLKSGLGVNCKDRPVKQATNKPLGFVTKG